MSSDYAFLKLQGINGEDYYIKKVPIFLISLHFLCQIPVKLSQQTRNYELVGSKSDFDYDSQILFKCSSMYILLYLNKIFPFILEKKIMVSYISTQKSTNTPLYPPPRFMLMTSQASIRIFLKNSSLLFQKHEIASIS